MAEEDQQPHNPGSYPNSGEVTKGIRLGGGIIADRNRSAESAGNAEHGCLAGVPYPDYTAAKAIAPRAWAAAVAATSGSDLGSGYNYELSKGGVKYDSGKPRFDLISALALEELAKVCTIGAIKYEARNWEKGMHWSRLFGAAMRHLWARWRRHHKDTETGLSHLAHAMWCVLAMLHFDLMRTETRPHSTFDDRPN